MTRREHDLQDRAALSLSAWSAGEQKSLKQIATERSGVAPPSLLKCECEHNDHFEQLMGDDFEIPPLAHDYGELFRVDQIHGVKTEWGTFHICTECKANCGLETEEGEG